MSVCQPVTCLSDCEAWQWPSLPSTRNMSMAELVEQIVIYLNLLIGYSISCWYGVWFVFTLVSRWIRDPSSRFWNVKVRELPPDCLNDPTLGTHAYIQLKNVKLHYVENGDRSKPLMLCLHGFPEFWYSWRHQLREFSSDYWVVAIDMRGYGDSEKPAGKRNYTINHLVADVKNVIIALGKEKCSLVAHDWGGIIAWFLLLQEPQMVDSYVIMNSGHPLAFMTVIKTSWKQFRMSWYVYLHQLPYLPELMYRMDDMSMLVNILKSDKSPSPLSEQDIEAFKFTCGKPGAFKHAIDYYRANFMMLANRSLKDPRKLDTYPPGLIIYGEDDSFVNKTVQEETVKLVKNVKLVCLPGANHFVQQDDPIAVNKEMRKFYGELKSKRN